MAYTWRQYGNDQITFPTPFRDREVVHPNLYKSFERGPYSHSARFDRLHACPGEKSIAKLADKTIQGHAGDLGWSLDYATAWCYRHLTSNRPEIADVIDNVRELDDVDMQTPYLIFEFLDKGLFGSKLRDMVCLRWRPQASCATGTTSAAAVTGVSRVCIELNSTPFEDDDDADIDDLLEALIHHMIHAYFLIACGAQPIGVKHDGRMSDGLHFGVLLLTIRDITKDCADGQLPLVFHASKRRDLESAAASPFAPLAGFNWPMQTAVSDRGLHDVQPFISVDPRGCAIGVAPADGQTHCLHDNRKISWQQIKNWQVEKYSLALDLDFEAKSNDIWDFDDSDKLMKKFDRLHGPPSVTYAELVIDHHGIKKHVMVKRERALQLKSIEWPLRVHGRYELEIPKCDLDTIFAIYGFIQKGCYPGAEHVVYTADMTQMLLQDYGPVGRRKTAPAIVERTVTGREYPGVIRHLRVFKVAEKLKFEELLRYAMARLWEMPLTTDNPIIILRELYDDYTHIQPGPIHSELHCWVREFLKRTESPADYAHEYTHGHGHLENFPPPHLHPFGIRGFGMSRLANLKKIQHLWPAEFTDLNHRSRGFRDDIKLVSAELMVGPHIDDQLEERELFWASSTAISSLTGDSSDLPPLAPLLDAGRDLQGEVAAGLARRGARRLLNLPPAGARRGLFDIGHERNLRERRGMLERLADL